MRELILFFILIFTYSVYGKNQIVAASEVELVGKKIITLGDVANIQDFSDLMSKSLAAVELGNAPEPGEERIFTNSAIALVFRKNMTHQELKKYQLKIPFQVKVKTKDSRLTEENLKNELMAHWQTKCSDCKFKIKYFNMPAVRMSESTGNWFLDAGESLPKGNFNVALHLENKDKSHRQYWVIGSAAILKKVPVAKRMIHLGEKLSPHHVVLEERDVTHSLDSTPDLSELYGKSINQVMRPGSILWHSTILREKAVLKGELVKLVTGGEKFELSTMGKANRDAYLGERVEVIPMGTTKPIFGAVIKKGEVRVE